MNKQELTDTLKSTSLMSISKSKQGVGLDIKNEIYKLTEFIDNKKETSLSLRVYCILNNITKIPKCKSCDNNATINKVFRLNSNKPKEQNGFNDYCSDKCRHSRKIISKEITDKLSNKDWLYDQRITQQKSINLISEELGCSTNPINTWIINHNIPKVNYQYSNAVSLSLLENKDWMIKKYIDERLTCEEIAIELNSTKSTVSLYLIEHDIERRNPNDYDRKNFKNTKPELEILEFLQSFYNDKIQQSNRTILGGYELDFYLPEHNFAIEFNGVYSHIYRPNEDSDSKVKGEDYHLNKTISCEEKGIHLLHIHDLIWNSNKKEIYKSMIKNKLGATDNKVFARKCTIKEIDSKTKDDFYESNHLQGKCRSTIKLGLFYNDLLVSVMTFGTPKYNKNYDYELIRFANLINYNVVGAFSKLLSHFRKNHKGSIISYADRTHSIGGVYNKNGFKLLHVNKPQFYYVDKNFTRMYHRSNFTKEKALKLLNKPELTEKEIMQELGYHRLYNCGTYTFILE